MTDLIKKLVSVVIPALNSQDTIGYCIESVKHQSHPHIEILVIDGGSYDDTCRMCQRHGVEVVRRRLGMAAARNYGASLAKGDFLLFIDSDMELMPKVIEECVVSTAMGYDALIIPERSSGQGFWSKCKALEKSCYVGMNQIESARFLPQNVFRLVGGYDANLLFGEDKDMDLRLRSCKFKVGRISSYIIHHEGLADLSRLVYKKYRYGKSFSAYMQKQRVHGIWQISPIRFLPLLKRATAVSRDPIYILGVFLMKCLEFAGVILGYAMAYMSLGKSGQ